jgi:hypothetical protein
VINAASARASVVVALVSEKGPSRARQKGVRAGQPEQRLTPFGAHHQLHAAISPVNVEHLGDHADRQKVREAWIFDFGVSLKPDGDAVAAGDGVEQGQRLRSTDTERHRCRWK